MIPRDVIYPLAQAPRIPSSCLTVRSHCAHARRCPRRFHHLMKSHELQHLRNIPTPSLHSYEARSGRGPARAPRGLTRFLEHFRSPAAGRRRKVTLLGLVCAHVCSAVSACVSQNELAWHQKSNSAQHLCVMNDLKKVFESPLGTMQTAPPRAREPQTCHLHVPPSHTPSP